MVRPRSACLSPIRLIGVICLIGPVFLLLAQPAKAEITLHGFIQGNYSLNTAAANPDGRDSKLAEERAQLKLEADQGPFSFFVKTDLAWDHLDDHKELTLREGTVAYTASTWDLKLGRQVITWGVGDLVFINDVFPKDYEAFFGGRPLEYLKKGVDGLKLGLYPDLAAFEIIVLPWFTANQFPNPRRYWQFDPLPLVSNRLTSEPAPGLANTEIAVRAYRDLAGFDVSLYGYRGFFRQPAMQPDPPDVPTQLSLWYPRLAVYGASLQGSALNGVVSLEAGYLDSRDDRSGDNPLIPNSQTRFLLGYQRQFWEDFTVGLQYYGEVMRNYGEYLVTLPPGLPKEKRLHDLASIRLTQFIKHQTMRLSLFVFRGLASKDYLINPEVKYNFTDQLWGALGANFFGGGEPESQFGQLDRNDLVYLQMRYEF